MSDSDMGASFCEGGKFVSGMAGGFFVSFFSVRGVFGWEKIACICEKESLCFSQKVRTGSISRNSFLSCAKQRTRSKVRESFFSSILPVYEPNGAAVS